MHYSNIKIFLKATTCTFSTKSLGQPYAQNTLTCCSHTSFSGKAYATQWKHQVPEAMAVYDWEVLVCKVYSIWCFKASSSSSRQWKVGMDDGLGINDVIKHLSLTSWRKILSSITKSSIMLKMSIEMKGNYRPLEKKKWTKAKQSEISSCGQVCTKNIFGRDHLYILALTF